MITVAAVITLGLHIGPGEVKALDFTHEVALRSPHVWRGITLREFSVLTGSVTARTSTGIAVQLWVGVDLSDDNERQGEVQEIDLDLSRTWSTGRSRFTLGYVALIFPGGIDPTGEAYVKWRYQGRLEPQLELFYNVNLLQDVFAQFSLNHQWKASPPSSPTVTASAKVAYAGVEYARFFGGSQAGLHHWGVLLDVNFFSTSSRRQVSHGLLQESQSQRSTQAADRLVGRSLLEHPPVMETGARMKHFLDLFEESPANYP